MRITMGIVAVCAAAAMSASAQKQCSPAEAAAAEKAIDRIVNWDQLYKAFKDYRHCDKGNVDEVFTEAVLRCIVEWKHVEDLAKSMQADAEFRDFVTRHLSSPAAKPDAEAVYSRAKMSCPKGLDEFCGQIASTVKPAAAEQQLQLSPMAPLSPAPAAAPPAKK